MATKYLIKNARIWYPTDPAIIARLQAGENIPWDARGMVSHVAGEIVDDIPACSIDDLLAEGAIVVDQEEFWRDLGRPADAPAAAPDATREPFDPVDAGDQKVED